MRLWYAGAGSTSLQRAQGRQGQCLPPRCPGLGPLSWSCGPLGPLDLGNRRQGRRACAYDLQDPAEPAAQHTVRARPTGDRQRLTGLAVLSSDLTKVWGRDPYEPLENPLTERVQHSATKPCCSAWVEVECNRMLTGQSQNDSALSDETRSDRALTPTLTSHGCSWLMWRPRLCSQRLLCKSRACEQPFACSYGAAHCRTTMAGDWLPPPDRSPGISTGQGCRSLLFRRTNNPPTRRAESD